MATQASSTDTQKVAHIAVVGAGWWSQGWHLPHLSRNPHTKISAIVDASAHPKSNLNPDLEALSALQEKYQCRIFSSVQELFDTDNKNEANRELAGSLDGIIVCTPHATHSDIGTFLLKQAAARPDHKPLHLLMEKPMTTNVDQARTLHETFQTTAKKDKSGGCFLVNHSANYIPQTKTAKELIAAGAIGDIQHITAFMASPLSWIFEDPANKGWNEPTKGIMLGNGFAWGQSSHLLAWIYHVCGDQVQPERVYCTMHHSQQTGADVSHAASIQLKLVGDNPEKLRKATLSLSGTSLLPGNAHSEPPVAKQIDIKIYGTKGALMYGGDDRDPKSGRLELRIGGGGDDEGAVKVHCEELGFQFEELDQGGNGPLSLQSFIAACLGQKDYYVGASSLVGLKSIQTLDAMYRSEVSGNAEPVVSWW